MTARERGAFSDKRAILDRFPFYRDATDAFRAEVEAAAHRTRLPAGSVAYLEGTRAAGFTMVGAGRVRVHRVNESGRQITLYDVGAGETCLVGMLSAILDVPAIATAVAHIDVTALVVAASTFRRWVRDVAAVRTHVFQTVTRRMGDLITLVEEVAFNGMDQRLAAFLLRRHDRTSPAGPTLEVTHEQLAVELGTSREVVSRLLEGFERHGGVALARGRILLKDRPTLKRIAIQGS